MTQTTTTTTTTSDIRDPLSDILQGDAVQALRQQREKVANATLGSQAAIFDPRLPGLTLAERLLAAWTVAGLSGSVELAAHYRAQALPLRPTLSAQEQGVLDSPGFSVSSGSPRLAAILDFSRALTRRPADSDRAALLRLRDAGLAEADVVTLAQLIAFITYQVRLVAGVQAMGKAVELADRVGSWPAEAGAAPAGGLPLPGGTIRIQGYTNESLGWKAWLPVVDLEHATPEQLAVLDASHPKARTSDYYRFLVHQPRILQERSVIFNAIMYAPGGLSRAERELASVVVSRVNGCVYCASVHAQRFEQLAKRNDAVHQVFTDPLGAGTSVRERALVRASVDLTRDPAGFGAAQVQSLRAAKLSDLEILDLVHAVAVFAWANRLMLNLGEAVFP